MCNLLTANVWPHWCSCTISNSCYRLHSCNPLHAEAQVHAAVTGPKTAQFDTAQHTQEAGCSQSGQPLWVSPPLPSASPCCSILWFLMGIVANAWWNVPSARIGDHSKKDPRHYSTMSSLFHSKPHRKLSQPNPEIAADASRRQHSKLGIHPETRRHWECIIAVSVDKC